MTQVYAQLNIVAIVLIVKSNAVLQFISALSVPYCVLSLVTRLQQMPAIVVC